MARFGFIRFALPLLALFPGVAFPDGDARQLRFDFAESDHGFGAGFADYPGDANPDLYEFSASRKARPRNLNGSPALFISGVNRSDDLFLFWKKRITGLPPDTQVRLTMELEFASKYAEGLIGVGGAPGEGVTVKVGAVASEPKAVLDTDEGWWRMNVDKGNQKNGGRDMSVVGDVAKPADGNEDYVLLRRHNHGEALDARTADDGSLWLIFGTDSGFEGETALYYSRLSVWLDRADAPHVWLERGDPPATLRLIWNQGKLRTTTALDSDWADADVSARPHVHDARTDPKRFWQITKP